MLFRCHAPLGGRRVRFQPFWGLGWDNLLAVVLFFLATFEKEVGELLLFLCVCRLSLLPPHPTYCYEKEKRKERWRVCVCERERKNPKESKFLFVPVRNLDSRSHRNALPNFQQKRKMQSVSLDGGKGFCSQGRSRGAVRAEAAQHRAPRE